MVPLGKTRSRRRPAKRLIIVAEELVPTEYIQREPERTIIPGHRVEAVVHQPFGAHPTAVFGCYDYDAEHLKLYAEQHKTPEKMDEYLQKYVTGTRDHWEYLEKVGGLRRMNEIKAEAIFGY